MARSYPDGNTIGGRLCEERLRLNMTQPQFGTLVGVGKGTALKWEQGTTYPTAAALAELAKIGVDVHYVIVGERLDTGNCPAPSALPQTGPALIAAQALALLPLAERRRVLLALIAEVFAA
jgi:transcriptional regulator with XRE-family HTH domain